MLVQAIIGLPANLFYGTGIPACIVVLDKENAHARSGIFMVNASKGFVKDGNKNRLRAQDLHKIVDAFTKQLTIDRYSRMVPLAEIEKQDFNLNIPRYIDSSEPEDLQDIEAHLKGGIPLRDLNALADYWAVFPSVRNELFGPGDRPGYASPKVEPSGVKHAILNHAEFAGFSARMASVLADWRAAHLERLRGIKVGDKPKVLIEEIAEDLLARFTEPPLIDKYDVYQHLMTYWAETMQDDVYIVAQEGWAVARQIRELVKNAEGKFTEAPDITLGKKKLKAELIPPGLILARFFAKEQVALEALEAKAEEIARAIEEMDEEHGSEDGLLFEAKTDKGKLTAKSIKEHLKDIKGDKTVDEEYATLNACLKLIEQEREAVDAVKEAKTELDTKIVKQYAKLTAAETKLLLVEDKWLATLQADIASELNRVSQGLTGRVKLLTERYAAPLPELAADGIALGVLELKRSTISVSEGIRQNLDNQKKIFIQHFFTTMQLIMAGNDTEGLRYGAIETPEKYYLTWKEPSTVENPLDRSLLQLCNKSRFLELIHDFLVFDAGIKKPCRQNQYFGVRAAQEHVKRREGGIIWHTQGSGKSLTMVWLAKWIRPTKPL